MAEPSGFLADPRRLEPAYRPVEERLRDYGERAHAPEGRRARAGRALHGLRHPVLPPGLPAREPDPRVERPGARAAPGARRSSACTRTNNFPEFTGKLCPAPCEAACVLDDQRRRRSRSRRSSSAIIERALRRGLGRAAARARIDRAQRRHRRLRAGGARLPRSSSPAPATRSPSSSATTARAASCATASPTSSSTRGPRSPPRAARGRGRASSTAASSVGRRHHRRRPARAGFDAIVLAVGAQRPRDLSCPAASSTACTSRWTT